MIEEVDLNQPTDTPSQFQKLHAQEVMVSPTNILHRERILSEVEEEHDSAKRRSESMKEVERIKEEL